LPSRGAAATPGASATASRGTGLVGGGARRARAHDRLDDPALAEVVPVDLVDDPATGHHHDAITEAGELERVARLDDRRHALPRLLAERVVDVEPRGDVDALRRLLGQDHLDVAPEEGTREGDLLLVAAGEELHGLLDRRRADAEAPNEVLDRSPLAASAHESDPAEASEDLDRRVGADAQDAEEGLSRAISAQQHDAGPKRLERRPGLERTTAADRAPGRVLGAGERPEELHLTVALRARDADDLALRDVQVDRPEPVAGQAGDGEDDLGLG